ncbi:hypothetical protein B0F90DRAFT_1821982 [Multifurca ochricompacta]|uniref:Uncharacterized protein n=1 Tax=Multifurca ochricompacta TaxID=376703 RepID=A0AAD4LWR0_9AGAM|nr:hypothetical protein B0F90DRAFT_1821982 [Multifurca ochricompacta]
MSEDSKPESVTQREHDDIQQEWCIQRHQVDAEQTPEEAGMEDGDGILEVELMNLTEGPSAEVLVSDPSILFGQSALRGVVTSGSGLIVECHTMQLYMTLI